MSYRLNSGEYVMGREENMTNDELWESNRKKDVRNEENKLTDDDLDRLWEQWMDEQDAKKEMRSKE